MKNKLIVFLSFLLFIVFVGNNVSAQTSSKPLVVSRCETAEILPITSNIDLFYHEDNFWLFEIEKTELKLLDKLGLKYQIIDAAGWSGEYYLLTPPERKALPGPLELGIQLYSKEDRTIVKISPSEEASLLQSGFKLMKISNTPKPIPPQSPPPLKLSVEQPDPVILSIIDKVSPDSLRAFVERLQNFRTRYTYSDSIIPAGQWIYDKYQSFGYTDVKFDTFYLYNVPHRNIIATKPGLVYPDSVLMIGGHYDATSSGNPYITAPGAEDNASGTVSAIESARILADYELEATVKFVAWDAEEIGLRGSQAYAEKARRLDEPVSFFLNFDMIGFLHSADPLRDVTIYTDIPSRPYAELTAQMARTYTTLIPIIPGNSGGSDHRSFQVNGFRSIFGFEGQFDFAHNPHYHKPTDLAENMNFDYMRETVQMGLATISTLAGVLQNLDDIAYVKLRSYSIDDDLTEPSRGNGNGFVDAGETIEITIVVENFGGAAASQVFGVLKTSDPLVTILSDTSSFGNLDASTQATCQSNFVIQISPSIQSGHNIKFYLTLSDDSGDSWENYFYMKVMMPELSFSSQTSQQITGNGDTIIDPGETFKLMILLNNTGLRTANQVNATIRSNNPAIVFTDSTAVFSLIQQNGSGYNGEDPFIFQVREDAQREIIAVTMELVEDGGFYSATIPFNLAIGQSRILLVEDDGKLNLNEYYSNALRRLGISYVTWDTELEGAVPVDTLNNFQRVIWYSSNEVRNSLFNYGTENLESYLNNGGNLFINGSVLPLSIIYKPLLSDYLKSKYVSFQTNLHHLIPAATNPLLGDMSFWLSQQGENSQNLAGEIDPLESAIPLLYYDQNTSEGAGLIRSSGTAALAVDNGDYRAVLLAFGWEGIEDEQLRIEILVRILNWLQDEASWVADDVAEKKAPKSYHLSQNFPNPFNPQTKIQFATHENGMVTITVFNTLGQAIRTLVDQKITAGNHTVIWDGNTSAGSKAASGVYFYQMKTENYQYTRKMILLY